MMHYLTTTEPFERVVSDCLVIPVLANHTLSSVGKRLDRATQGQISRIVTCDLSQKVGTSLMIYEPHGLQVARILVVSCGDQAVLSHVAFQKVMQSVGTAIQYASIQSVCCYIKEFPTELDLLTWKISFAIQELENSIYRFTRFNSHTQTEQIEKLIYFHVDEENNIHPIENAIAKGKALATGMKITKDLANTPANYATPTKVAAYAQQLAKEGTSLRVEVYDKDHEAIQGMGGFLGVAQGSDEPPKFVVISYTPSTAMTDAPIVLVGKGITFDSGGISLKPSLNMGEMKFDMTGAASVLGTIKAISMLQVSVPVVGLLPLTENLINGSALKPGDVITTLSKKTVEILDTDAEGRLVLADALTFARQFDPTIVIDIATLTGEIEVALGKITTGLMTTDKSLQQDLEAAGEYSVDRVWPLPLWEEYHTFIKSNVADISNLGHAGAGAITAGCFLSYFTKGLRWAHLDIAGTAYVSGRKKTATGRPVPLLVQFILNYSQQS